MTLDVFEREASHYEEWYSTPRGRRVDAAERELLEWLLGALPDVQSVLEVGCGAGHFTQWLASRRRVATGLDLSRAMLADARRRFPRLDVIVGDAHRLPLRAGSVDVVLFVATLEFLEEPVEALAEAARVARRGICIVALNRWSAGGISRRFGRQRQSPLLGRSKDWSARSLRRALVEAAGRRIAKLRWTSGLFPNGLWRLRIRLAAGGDVIGMAASLDRSDPRARPAERGGRGGGAERLIEQLSRPR